MLALHELQRRFAEGLIFGTGDMVIPMIAGEGERFAIYRRNRDAAIVNALKLTYPVVAALVGDAFFAQTALAFSRSSPPMSALFALYGAGFAEFLGDAANSLPYLPDVARLEWAVAQTAQRSNKTGQGASFLLGEVSVSLAASLILLPLDYPAADIWSAVAAEDEAALALIDPSPVPATVAIWRAGDGAAVRKLEPASAVFLNALIAGEPVDTALERASALATDPISVLSEDVLRASFVQLTPSPMK